MLLLTSYQHIKSKIIQHPAAISDTLQAFIGKPKEFFTRYRDMYPNVVGCNSISMVAYIVLEIRKVKMSRLKVKCISTIL
jgi:hypothetical protein